MASLRKSKKERNDEICARYKAGATLEACAEAFGISKERVRQVLRRAGVFKADRLRAASDRTAFLGVNLTPATKEALKVGAEERGASVSQFVSDALDDLVTK